MGSAQRWEIERNGHKPYACGVVLHPLIDAVIAHPQPRAIDPAAVERDRARACNPIAVLRSPAWSSPKTGLQSKFSIYHTAAVA